MPHLETLSLFLALTAAFVIGFSKSGLPTAAVLAVPLMATAFGARLSVGATLPMLIVGDMCAVYFHRANVQWEYLRRLLPSFLVGLASGTVFLIWLGKANWNVMNPLIGGIVLLMLILSLVKGKVSEKFHPTSPVGTVLTGALAGFTTMVANAAGPVWAIFMASTGMDKNQLIGTTAWYFFIFNAMKIPLILLVTYLVPASPMVNADTVRFDLLAIPVIICGAVSGRFVFDKISQRLFSSLVLSLAAVAAIRLLLSNVDFAHLHR